MLDKKNIISTLPSQNLVMIELGCGNFKKKPAYIGIDLNDHEDVDIVGDVYEVLSAFPNESVNEIHSFHFFEHIKDVARLLSELERILKHNGIIEIVAPHFSNTYFYSDFTHKNMFGLYSLSYLAKDKYLNHKVPLYNSDTQLSLNYVKLYFSSPLYINRPFRWLQQLLFNSFPLMKEWYEESWSRTFPCYEIKYMLTKV